LKNIELKAILADLGLKKSGNKDVLDDRILGREVVDVATTKKQPEWRNSKARAMLVRMLFDTNSKAHKLSWQDFMDLMNGSESTSLKI
jgi:hypothetical protein